MPEKSVQHVCVQIAAICRRLAGPWEAAAADMNLPSGERAEAAGNRSRLLGAATVIETYEGYAGIEDRVLDLEQRLKQVDALVGHYKSQKIAPSDSGAIFGQVLNELGQIVKVKD